MEEALKAATHPHDFKLLVASDGQRGTSVDSVMRRRAEDRHAPRGNGHGRVNSRARPIG